MALIVVQKKKSVRHDNRGGGIEKNWGEKKGKECYFVGSSHG